MKGRNRILLVLAAVAAVISFYAVAGYAQPPAEAPKPAAPAEAPKPEAPAAAPAEAPKPEAPPAEAPPPVAAPPAPAPAAAMPGMVVAFLWVNFILGLWLLFSPWVMGGEKASLKWSTTIVGLIVAILSIIGALS